VLHLLLYGLLAILLAAGLFVLAARFLPAGEQIAPPLRDEPPWELPPDRALHPDDVDGVRLPVALRGYRFAETDLLLDRLAGELRARDAEIARLRDQPRMPYGGGYAPAAVPAAVPVEVPEADAPGADDAAAVADPLAPRDSGSAAAEHELYAPPPASDPPVDEPPADQEPR
jgi:hypothetical protein